jgi:hypothetical protein
VIDYQTDVCSNNVMLQPIFAILFRRSKIFVFRRKQVSSRGQGQVLSQRGLPDRRELGQHLEVSGASFERQSENLDHRNFECGTLSIEFLTFKVLSLDLTFLYCIVDCRFI